MSPNATEDRSGRIQEGPVCASTPLVRPQVRSLINGYDAVDNAQNHCDAINGNVNVNIVTESTTSMDVLSGGESDAGDTLKRRNNNNSISSGLTSILRDGTTEMPKKRADVTYFVAKELLMTERTYKRDLELVTVTWSRRVSELATECEPGSDSAGDIAALARSCLALEPLALPAGALLARLERALAAASPARQIDNEEPEYKKIAELLHDYLSTTFDAYSTYVSHAGPLVALVESVRRGNADASRACNAFDATAPLPLSCLLLRPLHRLLHYERLATELYKAEGSTTSKSALELARASATAAKEQLRHSENHTALCQLQRDIIGYDKLLVAEREFVRLGCLYKHSTRGLQQRMLFLFNDVLVVASKPGGSNFRAHAALPLHRLQVTANELPHSFELTHNDVHLLFSASNDQEFTGWWHSLQRAIDTARVDPVDVDTELTPYEQEVTCTGTESSMLMGAGAGGGALPHVCWHRAASLQREHLHLALRTQLSGYLLRKFKKSPGWQKLWVVYAAFTLYFYKSWQDDAPLASLPLLGYGVGPPHQDDAIDKDFVFKLHFKNHVYFFRADSLFTYNRWNEVLQTALVRYHHDE